LRAAASVSSQVFCQSEDWASACDAQNTDNNANSLIMSIPPRTRELSTAFFPV
jgi:hypothetical protein